MFTFTSWRVITHATNHAIHVKQCGNLCTCKGSWAAAANRWLIFNFISTVTSKSDKLLPYLGWGWCVCACGGCWHLPVANSIWWRHIKVSFLSFPTLLFYVTAAKHQMLTSQDMCASACFQYVLQNGRHLIWEPELHVLIHFMCFQSFAPPCPSYWSISLPTCESSIFLRA